ncbi:hypothetical protein P9112_011864 [Eukaryota sp. TZLM1-RC]
MLSRQVPTTDPVRINTINTGNTHSSASENTYEPFHPIYYIRNYNPSDDSALPDPDDLSDTHKILILKEKCASAIPMFDQWLTKIRSEQRLAVAAHERSFNNCSVIHLDLYVNESGKIIIPSSLINDTLLIIHGYVSGGHPSMSESLHMLSSSDYYWPSMTDDIKNHVRSCPSFQKTSPVPKFITPSTGSLWADKPFVRLNVDTIGPLPPDQEDNYFTRYTILVFLKEVNARLTADALIWSVCAIFGIPNSFHSDNGPEFANNVFKLLCEFLSIDVTNSIPNFSQSNGLVERRHRVILQNLRKLLIDFNAYDNWSEYIPYVQLLTNSSKSSVTGFSPFELMFGSDVSPRADPLSIFSTIEKATTEVTFILDIQSNYNRLKEKREKAEITQISKSPEEKPSMSNLLFEVGCLILKSFSNSKLHGNYLGPYLVIDKPSKSTLLIKNLITGVESKASISQCKLYHFDKPTDDEFYCIVASGDTEEHLLLEVLSQDGNECQVVYAGDVRGTEPVDRIKNTKAYRAFLQTNKSRPPTGQPTCKQPRRRARKDRRKEGTK